MEQNSLEKYLKQIKETKEMIDRLLPKDRLLLFMKYCRSCGCGSIYDNGICNACFCR